MKQQVNPALRLPAGRYAVLKVMRHKFTYFLLITSFMIQFELKSSAQSIIYDDSITICRTITDFYSWYINAIKSKNYSDYEPEFIRDNQGMTTLNLSKYIQNLKNLHVSDSLIEKEKKSYRNCILNLGKINYSEFKKKFIDLDDFENIDCAFGNVFKWIGVQDPIDGIHIVTLQKKDVDTYLVIINYFDQFSFTKGNFFGYNQITLKRNLTQWEIFMVSSNKF